MRLHAEGTAAATREFWRLVRADLRRSARIRTIMDHLAETMIAGRPLLAGTAPVP